jgi:hypothetical protein
MDRDDMVPEMIQVPKLYPPAFGMLTHLELATPLGVLSILQVLGIKVIVPHRASAIRKRSLLECEPLVTNTVGTLCVPHDKWEGVGLRRRLLDRDSPWSLAEAEAEGDSFGFLFLLAQP